MPSLVGIVLCHFNRPLFKGFRKRIKKACKKLTGALHKSKKRRVHCKKQFASVSVQTSFESVVQTLSHEGELDMSHHNSSQNNRYDTSRPTGVVRDTSSGPASRSSRPVLLPSKHSNPSSSRRTATTKSIATTKSTATSTSTPGSENKDRSYSLTRYGYPGSSRDVVVTRKVSTRTPSLPTVPHSIPSPPPSRRRRSNSFTGGITSYSDRTSGPVSLSSPRERRRELKRESVPPLACADPWPIMQLLRSSSVSSLTAALSYTNLNNNTGHRHHSDSSLDDKLRVSTSTKAEESPITSTRAPSERRDVRYSKAEESPITSTRAPSERRDVRSSKAEEIPITSTHAPSERREVRYSKAEESPITSTHAPSERRDIRYSKAEESPLTSICAHSERRVVKCSKNGAISEQISPIRTKDRSDSPNTFFAKLLRSLGTKSRQTQATPVGVEGVLRTGGIVGLRNMGNTCFMNSALQCLSHTLELTQEYLRTDIYSERNAVGKAYAQLMQDMWPKKSASLSSSSQLNLYQSISPQALKLALSRVHAMFAGYGQQDSQELLRLLVSELHEEYKRKIKKNSSTLVPISGLSDDIGDERWHSYFKHEDTPISRVFMGQLRSTLICDTCKEVSTTFDPFWDLPLPIPNRPCRLGSNFTISDLSLEDCITHFTKEEILDGSNKAYCNNCRALRRTRKRFTVHRFPPVLVVYLQRFSSQSYRNKLSTIVNIPTVLDLTNYASKESVKNKYSGKKLKYELYATSNHIGSVSFGHYTALAKHYATDQWYHFNDSCVQRIASPARYLNSGDPYMMFYRRTLSTE